MNGITRTTVWKGKVGFIYPSDWGYAADLGICQSKSMTGYNGWGSYASSGMSDECIKSDWLGKKGTWNISPSSVNSGSVMFSGFYVDTNGVFYDSSTRPTLLLDSSALAESGNGSKETPYVLTS